MTTNEQENQLTEATTDNKMNRYTIVSTITEVDNNGKVHLKGLGKYIYEKDEKTKWLVLEGNSPISSKFLDGNTEFVLTNNNEIMNSILATAMINGKALELTVEESSNNGFSYNIISIKNP